MIESHRAVRELLARPGRRVRNVFDAAGLDGEARHHALRCDLTDADETFTYLCYAETTHGVPGWRQHTGTYAARPVEIAVEEIDAQAATVVSLSETPAWVVSENTHGVPVSWHARVRWVDRAVDEWVADPGPAVGRAAADGLAGRNDGDRVTFHAPTDSTLVRGDDAGGVVTVLAGRPDRLDAETVTCGRCDRVRRVAEATCPQCDSRATGRAMPVGGLSGE